MVTHDPAATPELLLDDAPGPAFLALILARGRTRLPLVVRTVASLDARFAAAHPAAIVLVPVAEYALLQETHLVAPAPAIAGTHRSAVALVADRPLDQVEAPRLEFDTVSRTAECLARATILRFYGIRPAMIVRNGVISAAPPPPESAQPPEPDSDPTVVPGEHQLRVLEGAAALQALDGEANPAVADLGRAWFILTGLPPVSHLLLVPKSLLVANPNLCADVTASLSRLVEVTPERKRTLRNALAERYGISRETANAYYSDLQWTFNRSIQQSAVQLFSRGAWGLNLPLVRKLRFVEPPVTPAE